MKNFYVSTLSGCIRSQCKSAVDNSRLLFMVPGLTGADTTLLLADCKDIATEYSRQLVFRIADECRTAPGWMSADVSALDSYFAGGNLTQYRNDETDGRLVVLVGVDLAADRGSLADFYRRGADALFAETMGGTFRSWVSEWLGTFGIEASKEWGKAWDSVLGVLADDASLSYLSRLFGAVTVEEGIGSEQEAMAALLRRIEPNLSAFAKKARKPGRQTFRYYVNAATTFFNYGAFLDESARTKALKAIDDFEKKDPPPALDETPFASREELLAALRGYIENHNTERVDELRRADFIAINDLILKAKPPKDKSKKAPKDTLQKLSGSPLEVLLLGAWRAFGEFAVQTKDGDNAGAIPARIEFTGVHFRHDVTEQAPSDEIEELCREPLRRLLGGLDEMLGRIRLHLDAKNPEAEVAVVSNLIPTEGLSVKPAKASEPYFEFHVEVSGPGGMPKIRRRFALRLPDIHPYRLADDLLGLAMNSMEARSTEVGLIPVFHLPYYRELLLSREGEETSRVLDAALRAQEADKFLSNVFTHAWRADAAAKPMRGLLDDLSRKFREFLHDCREKGLHAVVGQEATVPFVKAYQDAVEAFAYGGEGTPAGATDAREVGAMLMRAFLFVDGERDGADIDTWGVEKYEGSALVTILHPALVEMLQAQWVFLLDAFAKSVETEFTQEKGAKTFKDRVWTAFADLAAVKAPLVGLPVTESGKFVVTDPGTALVFRIGSLPPGVELAATRFLTRYNQVEDDEIADEDLVRETSESRLLCRTLCDFFRLHAGAKDGLTLVVYRNEDIQPVLAGIDAYVRFLEREIPPESRVERYSIRLTVFSESSDTSVVAQWLSAWQDYIESKDDVLGSYADCDFSVSHRLVGQGTEGVLQLAKTIRSDVDADVFVLYDFIRPDNQGCVFEKAAPYVTTNNSIKFPILEQSQCASTKPNERFRRSQIVSNRQFKVADAHANLSARVKDPGVHAGDRHIILATGDYTPWRDVVDAAHETAEWVVAVDPLIDRALVAQSDERNSVLKRELIGFGSGVGQHGESNYTISTQQYRLGELKDRLLSAMRGVFPYGSPDRDARVAQTLLDEAKELSGLSLVRAIGPGEYVRDFLAYGILHRIIPLDPTAHLCDRLFSIDAYRHWFDLAADDNRHPDLLWLRADIVENKLHLRASLIECKMGKSQNMVGHLEKAKTQIENGLRVLRPLFAPSGGSVATPRPDQRYWHLQLHRMIASAAPSSEDKSSFLSAMENLADGKFEIEWDAGVYTFVTDETRGPALEQIEILTVAPDKDGETMEVPVFQSGYAFIDAVCQPGAKAKLAWKGAINLSDGASETEYGVREDRLVDEDDEVEDEDDAERQDFDVDDDEDGESVVEPGPITGETSVPIPSMPQPVSSSPQTETSAIPAVETPPVGELSTADSALDSTISVPEPIPASPSVESVPNAIPDRILLGKTKGGKDVFWEFGHPKLNNRHLLIFGNSGMGKTYAIQAILCELARKGQNDLIVDYTDGFLPNQLQSETNRVLQPVQEIVKTKKLPINPFRRQSQDIGGGLIIEDSELDVGKRVASIFESVYELGEQQVSILIDAVRQGVETHKDAMTLDKLMPILESYVGDGVHPKASASTLLSKIKPFIEESPFATGTSIGWQGIFADSAHRCRVFQMVKIDKTTARALTEFVLWDLWTYVCSNSTEKTPHVVVLDEVQNLDHRQGSPLEKMLREGRKFGVSLILATQTLSNLKKEEQAQLFQSGHKLFFRPADPEIGQYADFLYQMDKNHSKDSWKEILASLGKGDCLSVGPAMNPATGVLAHQTMRIRISALEDRGF